jgi:general secretion pathway protein C
MSFLTSLLQFVSRKQASLWLIALVGSIAFFTAKSVNLWLAYRYFPLDFTPASPGSVSPSSLSPATDTRAILKRNIFDSAAATRVTESAPSLSGAITPSTLPLELMGTIVFENPRYSVALIKDRGSNQHAYYGVGESVSSARLRQVERFRVILENQGRLESLDLKAAASKLDLSPLRPTTSAAPSPSRSQVTDFEEIGPNRFLVPQSYLDEALQNFNVILTQARMVPNLTPDNRTDGFRVFAIKPDSIFEKMGMKDQDIIKRVNGQDMDSFEKATGLFGALRNEKTISIDIMRNGTRINYSYEIR